MRKPSGRNTAGRIRADVLLVERGLVESRAKAQALILSGAVLSGTRRIDKAGELLASDAELSTKERPRFVSRGGEKLDGAIEKFALDVRGLVCADVGASTGGFTDCLLQRGAARVFAIDVGHGQLDERLRRDERVTVMERTNARHLTREVLGGTVDLVVVDVSFIGLEKLMTALLSILAVGGRLLALVKPQFEVGREEATRARGVIRDDALRLEAVGRVKDALVEAGFELVGEADSVLPGPKGNRERFVLSRLVRTPAPQEPASTQTS
jgi:23S rRNA (cytidine1920-2'-O)/16S rRNA (cytidine1409-2'-O)-methyltransferase